MSFYEKLSPRNRKIVDAYCNGAKGSDAYRAGVPNAKDARGKFYRFKQREDIKGAIAERMAEEFAGTEVTRQMIINELARVAFGNIKALFDEVGQLRPVKDLTDAEAAMVAGIDVEALYEGTGRDKVRTGDIVKIKSNDKVRALEGLARIGGMNKDKFEHSGSVGTTPPVIQLVGYDDENPTK